VGHQEFQLTTYNRFFDQDALALVAPRDLLKRTTIGCQKSFVQRKKSTYR